MFTEHISSMNLFKTEVFPRQLPS